MRLWVCFLGLWKERNVLVIGIQRKIKPEKIGANNSFRRHRPLCLGDARGLRLLGFGRDERRTRGRNLAAGAGCRTHGRNGGREVIVQLLLNRAQVE
jgi:hypothetical protein